MSDPIADMLNRIRNAQAVLHPTVEIPWSKEKYLLAKLLEKNGFFDGVESKGRQIKKTIKVNLKYHKDSEIPGAIHGLRRISKPGQRIYLPATQIKKVRGGYGIAIISTSKGLITDKEARKHKIGGEVICEIW